MSNDKSNWRELDTYEADLLNEDTPRREEVTEIQDTETGDLLCYANPEHAARIVACVNACAGINPEAVPDMLEALRAISAVPGTISESAVGAECYQALLAALRLTHDAIAKATGA